MISLKSIRNFFITNSILVLLSILQYVFFGFSSLIIKFLTILIRNYILMKIINYGIKKKKFIGDKIREPVEGYNGEFHVNVVSASVIEAGTIYAVEDILIESSYQKDLIYFIPISFIYEVIFDFFHYWTHRIIHMNKNLYYHTHKKHHKYSNPITILTFYQHPIDLLITNSFPNIISLLLVNSFFTISSFMYSMIIIYKTYIEISGHTGKNIYPISSFSQFIWLPRLLNIELHTEEHDLHHTLNNCNYGKRFSLWDKIFCSFVRYK